jgi:hypothetical protein
MIVESRDGRFGKLDAKIGGRHQIAQQNANLWDALTRANLVPVTDFLPGLAVSRQKPDWGNMLL